MRRSTLDSAVLSVAFLGVVVLVNILALDWFFRIDLTESGQYTLSGASREAVRDLDDRLTVKAYFSEDLPPPYSQNARYVKDLLDEYYAASDGDMSYEFLDPAAEETEEDRERRKELKRDIFGRTVREETEVERELRRLGIQPVEVRVAKGDSFEAMRVYMGISLRYGDEREVIPVVTDTSTLEYDLTTLIRRLTREDVPTVGIVTGRGGPDLQRELGSLTGLIGQQYELRPLDLAESDEIPGEIDALMVIGPSKPFEQPEIDAIRSFVESGHAAGFFLDEIKVDLAATSSEPAEHGLSPLLATWGVRVRPGLVLDTRAATISVTQQRGFMRIAQPVQYPYLPVVPQLEQDHPVTRGLGEIVLPFVSPLEITADENPGLDATVLVSSSEESWVETPPYDLNPLKRWPETIRFGGPYPLLAVVSGIGAGEDGAAGRILVVGGSMLLGDQFMSATSQALMLNLVDWLLLDEAMLQIRTRGLAPAPIEELSDATRATLKWGNVVGVPLLFVLIGIVLWRLREARRRKVQAAQLERAAHGGAR